MQPIEIGTLLSAGTLVRLSVGPFLGSRADRIGPRRMLVFLAPCASALGLGYLVGTGFSALLLIALVHSAALAALNPLADAMALSASRREAIKHSAKRELPPEPALLIPAVRLPGYLTGSLVDLNPTRLDVARGAYRTSEIVGEDVGRKSVMAVVGHPDHVGLVLPRDGDEDGSENFFARKSPVVARLREPPSGA